MKTEKFQNGIVMIELTKEELEDSIAGLSQLKPILQAQVIRGNGKNVKQAKIDSEELGSHFDTAITAMTMLLAGFEEPMEGAEEHDSKKRQV